LPKWRFAEALIVYARQTSASTRRQTVTATAIAMLLFLGAWVALHHGLYARLGMVDTPTYERYGDMMVNARLPYRDFGLEYPPAALPMFAVPSLISPIEGDLALYARWFELEMFLCGAASIGLVAFILARDGAPPHRLALALAFVALAPLMIGNVMLSRFDLWPVALTMGALAAMMAGRPRLGSAVLGVAFAAKLYPAVLLPLALVWVWKRSGRREAIVALAAFSGAAAASFAPVVVLSPHGVWDALTRQTNRPLQIESLGASILLVVHAAVGLPLTVKTSFGSQNLVGAGPTLLAAASTTVELAAIVSVWIWFARGPANSDRLLRGWAAAVCAFIAFGKVLSPQFLIWLIPLVPLVGGRRGLRAATLLGTALILTQLWFPARYWELARDLATPESILVLTRDVTLVALLLVLLARHPDRSASPGQGPTVSNFPTANVPA
jgi:uncharacterized membrane protein